MKILFVASEATPYAASGGLGDVMGALPKSIVQDNPSAEVGVVVPLSPRSARSELGLREREEGLRAYP